MWSEAVHKFELMQDSLQHGGSTCWDILSENNRNDKKRTKEVKVFFIFKLKLKSEGKENGGQAEA